MSSAKIVVVCPVVFLFVHYMPSSLNGAQVSNDLKAAAIANLANRASFTRFRCTFRVRSGVAPDLKSAMSGPVSNIVTAVCEWSVNESNECLRVEGGDFPIQASGGVSAPRFPKDCFLRGGGFDLIYYPDAGGASLSSTVGTESLPTVITPFSMGIMGQGENASPARRVLDNIDGAVIDELAMGNDGVRFRWSRNGSTYEYTFDPSKGFLLRDASFDFGEGNGLQVFVVDARACGNGRWFPIRSVYVIKKDAASGAIPVREVIVTALELDKAPELSEFSLDLPAHTHINDQRALGSQIVTDSPRRCGIADLPNLFKRTREAIEESKEAVAKAQEVERRRATGQYRKENIERSSDSLLRVVLLGANIVVMAGLLVLWKRRRAKTVTVQR
jgi:hypothetical protein